MCLNVRMCVNLSYCFIVLLFCFLYLLFYDDVEVDVNANLHDVTEDTRRLNLRCHHALVVVIHDPPRFGVLDWRIPRHPQALL